jgi:adenosylcobinamide-phosphate synthase
MAWPTLSIGISTWRPSGDMWRVDPLQIVIAIALDCLLGDPRGWPHVARVAGRLAAFYEKLLTARLRRSVPLGLLFWLLVTGTMLAAYAALWRLCIAFNPVAARILETLVIYQTIAATDLSRHVKAIIQPLGSSDLVCARNRLAWIVGRDTQSLEESDISRAAIESVAESTTDAVIAPLFWGFIAGAPGALIYRTANTLDSIVGHRTDAYEKFGKASARIDDLLNWLPSRLCAAVFCLFSSAVRWNTIRREAAAHASPNAGWSEAAMAYALGIRLGGDNSYDGQSIHGPVFNASSRAAAAADITASLAWMWRVTAVCAASFVMLRLAVKLLRPT